MYVKTLGVFKLELSCTINFTNETFKNLYNNSFKKNLNMTNDKILIV